MHKTAAISRTSAAKAAWLIVVLIVAVPVFIFWPQSSPPPEESMRNAITRPPSELTKVGLPDDRDLEGLPEFFAVWAEHAEWKDNKTQFAYRHPVSGKFAYFFEATRTTDGYRFRPIARPDWDLACLEIAAEGSPIGLPDQKPAAAGRRFLVPPDAPGIDRAPSSVDVHLDKPAVEPPKPTPKS